MVTSFSVDGAAADLLEARHSRRALAADRPGPGSRDEAFAVQDRVARRLGPPCAWKIGGGGIAAPIAGSFVRPSPAVWSTGDLFRLGIEAEIAFRFGRDVPACAGPDEIRAAISSIHAAIEIVDSRLDTWPVPDPLWALADNQNNGGLVYGLQGRPFAGEDLSRLPVRLTADGAILFDGEGVNPGGDPFALLLPLVAHAVERGGLQAGMLATTGSLTGVDFVPPGSRVIAQIADLPPVEVTFPA